MAKWFCGNGFAWAADAARFFFSVPTVIAGSAIAAWPAATKPGSVSGAAPIAGTNKVRKDGLDHRDRQREYRQRRAGDASARDG